MSHRGPRNIPDFKGPRTPPNTGVWLPAVKPGAAGAQSQSMWPQVRHARQG